jgi:DNA-binding beta-propeller fold protein YncE
MTRPAERRDGFGRGHARRHAMAFAIACSMFFASSSSALAATGDLTQPSGAAGCISDTGTGPCADGRALSGAQGVAVSPDGKSVYAAAFNGNGVAILNRNTSTGALNQPGGTGGCISQGGAGSCAAGHALSSVIAVAVSPDNKNVYAVTFSNAVVRLDRNTTTGALTQPAGAAGCISQTGAGPCADGHGLKTPVSVTVSPDGKTVYVTSTGGDDVARFTRNTTTGALHQPPGPAGCVSETGAGLCVDGHALSNPRAVTVSPNGKSVYVASAVSNAVVRFDRNTTTGALTQPGGTAGCISIDGTGGECAVAPGINGYLGATTVVVSQDGTSVYLGAGNGVAKLTRNTTTGAITQPAGAAGCIAQHAADFFIPCADAHGLGGPTSVVVSPDGRNVYVATTDSNSVARLTRNTTTGVLSQPAGTQGCVNQDGTDDCADGHALRNPASVAASADGKSVYVGAFVSDAVARFNRAP